MLGSVQELESFGVEATDGRGRLVDFSVDDGFWAVRLLVVKTDAWASGRTVLISPLAIGRPDAAAKVLPARVTREQVRMSPDVDSHQPVSSQQELENFGYYGYPFHWGGSGMWGNATLPALMLTVRAGDESAGLEPQQRSFVEAQAAFHRQRGDDPHLRSCRAISGYHLHARDGEVGHVEGFIVDDESWAIRYLLINTSDWCLGHQMLIASPWIADIRWIDATVHVDLTRQAVKDAPRYDGQPPPDRVRERVLHDHYGRAGYWVND